MPAPYISTPHATDASHLTNGLERLGEMSPEKSFVNPPQGRDLISQMKSIRRNDASLKTPRNGARDPLRLLPNGNQGKNEFTPLMKSAVKNNMARRLSSKKSAGIETPAYLRNGYVDGKTPVLPKMDDNSHIQSENTSSSAGHAHDYTPMPNNVSSSAQSTPLAQLPQRDAGGVVNDGNMMTLREQENIIDKIEKENFGLKMKIHFLEEAMSKRGGEFNHAALKENTDLKVNRITMQRELHKFKKNIAQAERDAETYRLQLEEYRERIRRKQVDETIRLELESLRSELKVKQKEITHYQERQDVQESRVDAEANKLRGSIEDLQAEIREKDREIDSRDDEIDQMKLNASKDSNVSAELEDELESAKQEVDELKQDLERANQEAADAREERDEAVEEKRKAEDNLDELQDEMANKSFTTKGLSRQLEEKANKLEDDLEDLQERHNKTEAELEEKAQSEKRLQERVRELEKEGVSDARNLHQELEISQQQRDTLERKLNSMSKQLENAEKEWQVKLDEKNLLQTRHDALTTESAQLQKDLAKARKSIQELEGAVDDERQRSAQQDNILRNQHQHDLDVLNDQIDNLHRDVNRKENEHAADIEEFEAKRKSLEVASHKAEEKATGLQRTVDKLQDSQGTMSGREMRLQEAAESEKQRHLQEEKLLSTQIEELHDDLAAKRLAAESNRSELNNAKEELRISIREQAVLKEKVAELEEEIEVLQADIEQEHELVERFQKKSNESADAQTLKLKQDKQSLQDSLANVQIDLESVRRELQAAEADREDLEGKLEKAPKSADDTFNVDSEKRELRRTKQKLEKEVERLRSERDKLQEANNALEDEINKEVERANAEENRLSEELDRLRNKQLSGSETRDRELKSAKNKAERFEARIKELEEMLDNHSRATFSPEVDLSGLRHDLEDARTKEAAAIKRETDLKSSSRDLKMKVNDLERQLHEARLTQLKSRSPSASPPNSKELSQVRQELVEARSELREAQTQIRGLKLSARRAPVDETDHAELQSLAKAAEDEADMLDVKVKEQQDLIAELRAELNLRQSENRNAGIGSFDLRRQDRQIRDLKAQLRQTHEGQSDVNDLSIRLSTRNGEIREMKKQLVLIREERKAANEKADAVESELETLQNRYENMLEKLSSGKHSAEEIRQKEIKGLIKQIMWLKAKFRREERLRKDLAFSKNYLEQGEAMRVQCNQIDLRILREMGVEVDKTKYQAKKLRPIQKFRAGVYAVIAAIRMSDMEEQWREAKKIGEQLQTVKSRQVRTKARTLIREV